MRKGKSGYGKSKKTPKKEKAKSKGQRPAKGSRSGGGRGVY